MNEQMAKAKLEELLTYVLTVKADQSVRSVLSSSLIQLSIPRGQSSAYNAEKFAQPKRMEHFTESFLRKSTRGTRDKG